MVIKVSLAANQHIRMISEGSRDTEDWRNDAENSALTTRINYILQYIQYCKTVLLNCNNISQYTRKNKGASKGSSSDAIEEPFLVPQRTIQSKNHLFPIFL